MLTSPDSFLVTKLSPYKIAAMMRYPLAATRLPTVSWSGALDDAAHADGDRRHALGLDPGLGNYLATTFTPRPESGGHRYDCHRPPGVPRPLTSVRSDRSYHITCDAYPFRHGAAAPVRHSVFGCCNAQTTSGPGHKLPFRRRWYDDRCSSDSCRLAAPLRRNPSPRIIRWARSTCAPPALSGTCDPSAALDGVVGPILLSGSAPCADCQGNQAPPQPC
jgi:hypothetical protein